MNSQRKDQVCTPASGEESPCDRRDLFSPKAASASTNRLDQFRSPTTAFRRPFRQVQPVNTPQTFQKLTSSPPCLVENNSNFSPLLKENETKLATFTSNLERHSSEEELSVINSAGSARRSNGSCEKRKHSDASPTRDLVYPNNGRKMEIMSDTSMCDENMVDQTRQSSTLRSPRKLAVSRGKPSLSVTPSSADEEVKDVWFHSKPSKFSASPPHGIRNVRLQTVSPRKFLANVAPGANSTMTSSQTSCWKSPRKRQRQLSRNDSDDYSVIQRPFIDLEKMQVCFRFIFSSHCLI